MTSAGDPRFLRSREAILDAARELLLAQGPAAVTHQQIATHAGIGRATVYRHWPRTDQLLAEAMATVPMAFFDVPQRPLRAWLVGELTAIARQLEHHDVLAVSTTLANAAVWDAAMDDRRAGFAAALTERLAAALAEAQRVGELELRVDPGTAAALTVGPVYYRATIEHSATDPETIEHCVAALGVWTDL
jgi:AcrR family transcriptional regulator